MKHIKERDTNNDNTESIPYLHQSQFSNETMFNFLNSDHCYKFILPDDNDKLIEQFNKYTVDDHYEGVVIKPNDLHAKCLPYMKVRNKNYLTIVYGYDYLNSYKYDKLISRKNVSNKMKMSQEEWKIGLLSIPYNQINDNNETLKSLYARFLDEDSSFEIDPRL